MTADLDKRDLVSLVAGTTPDYTVMSLPLIAQCGSYTGGFHDRWDWSKTKLDKLTEEQLWEVYQHCKQSWK